MEKELTLKKETKSIIYKSNVPTLPDIYKSRQNYETSNENLSGPSKNLDLQMVRHSVNDKTQETVDDQDLEKSQSQYDMNERGKQDQSGDIED